MITRIRAGAFRAPLPQSHRVLAFSELDGINPQIQAWLASQPPRVIEAFKRALQGPQKLGQRRAKASAARGLTGYELREFEKCAGVCHVAASMPRRDEHGQLVVHNITPSEVRRIQAARAGGK